MALYPKPSAASISAFRDAHATGMIEAKAQLMARWRRDQLAHLRTMLVQPAGLDTLQSVVLDLVTLMEST